MVSPIDSNGAHYANAALTSRAPKATAPDHADKAPQMPGVIRNLIDGHYTGVADVRLRLVHADRIAALQLDADERLTAATHESMVGDLKSVLDSFVVANSTGDETLDSALGAAASTFIADVGAAGSPLEDALAALEASLRDVLKPLPVEQVSAQNAESGGMAALEEDDPTGDLMTQLRATVDASQASPAANSVLPALGDYTGNGKAYVKFVELYRAMNSPPVSVSSENSIELSA